MAMYFSSASCCARADRSRENSIRTATRNDLIRTECHRIFFWQLPRSADSGGVRCHGKPVVRCFPNYFAARGGTAVFTARAVCNPLRWQPGEKLLPGRKQVTSLKLTGFRLDQLTIIHDAGMPSTVSAGFKTGRAASWDNSRSAEKENSAGEPPEWMKTKLEFFLQRRSRRVFFSSHTPASQ